MVLHVWFSQKLINLYMKLLVWFMLNVCLFWSRIGGITYVIMWWFPIEWISCWWSKFMHLTTWLLICTVELWSFGMLSCCLVRVYFGWFGVELESWEYESIEWICIQLDTNLVTWAGLPPPPTHTRVCTHAHTHIILSKYSWIFFYPRIYLRFIKREDYALFTKVVWCFFFYLLECATFIKIMIWIT